MAELKVYLFRHGTTPLNEQGRMCGRYNALVSEAGWENLRHLKANYEYPEVEKVYASPAIRCRETASVLFPDQTPELVENFWEFDFGDYEDAWIGDVRKMDLYPKWMRQDMDCGFPGGETMLEARFRALAAMTHVVKDCLDNGFKEVAVVAHGKIFNLLIANGTLITDEPAESFVLCPNGMGYAVTIDSEGWFSEQKMDFVGFYPPGAPRPRPEDSPYFANFDEDEEEEKSEEAPEAE